jgi:hypothetical protein
MAEQPHLPVTRERRETYLQTLRETGSHEAAAAAATPHGKGARPGGTTFRELRRRDPEFEIACKEAQDAFLGSLEKTIAHWATTGRERPIIDKNGNVVAVETFPPDAKLLLAALRRLAPDRWNERQQLEVSGTLHHQHADAMAVLTYDDAMLLPRDDRNQLATLLQRVSDLRATRDEKVIEHDG